MTMTRVMMMTMTGVMMMTIAGVRMTTMTGVIMMRMTRVMMMMMLMMMTMTGVMGRLEGRVPRHQTALLSADASCKQFKFTIQNCFHDCDDDEDRDLYDAKPTYFPTVTNCKI